MILKKKGWFLIGGVLKEIYNLLASIIVRNLWDDMTLSTPECSGWGPRSGNADSLEWTSLGWESLLQKARGGSPLLWQSRHVQEKAPKRDKTAHPLSPQCLRSCRNVWTLFLSVGVVSNCKNFRNGKYSKAGEEEICVLPCAASSLPGGVRKGTFVEWPKIRSIFFYFLEENKY